MRPTELHFRNPKEKTAEYNMPVVTKEGIVLLPTVCAKKHPTFSKSKRFSQYDDHAKITGYRVGPGSYRVDNSSVGKARVKGTHVYKKFHGKKDVANNGYFFIGNHMVFDASFVLPSRKSPSYEITRNQNFATTAGTFQRTSSLSTPSRHRRSDSSKPRIMSPNFTNY